MYHEVKKFENLMSITRQAIEHHFFLLNSDLEINGGPYICGLEYTLADVRLIHNSSL